jgi:very-short-patch-repair endonuclease
MELGALRALAAAQHGVISRTQARAAGLTSSAIRHRVARGEWEELTPNVFRMAGTTRSDQQRAHAAVLDVPGSVISHEASAAVWEWPGFRFRPAHVVHPLGANLVRSSLAIVHSSTHLPRSHQTVHHGVPVTTPVRTLFDLASRVHPLRMSRLVDTAWAMRLVTGVVLHDTLEDHAERGRPGIQIMREILADRPRTYRPPDSNLEARFQEIARSIGLTTLRRQVDIGAEGWVGRVDFLDSKRALVLEVDSERFHGSLTDQAADDIRRRALIDAGFIVERIEEFDVWHRPDIVRDQLRSARRRAAGAP